MPEADFQQISEFLSRGGYDPATEELLDFVWCSPWLCFRRSDPVPPEPTQPPPKAEDQTDTDDRTGPDDPPPAPDPAPTPPPKAPAPAPKLPAPSGIGKEEDQRQDVGLDAPGSSRPARRVRLAGARPFREALSLTEALRPLRFGVPEPTGQLDEDGTADFLARTGLLMPCWESRKVSPFRIEVVLESTRGVLFWSAWVRHWVELLRQATRSRVTLSYLIPVADADSGTRRHPFILSPLWPAERGAHPETLGHPGRKRLIFLFTDMLSPLWKEDGPMPALLRDWSRHQTVTILNPLHRDIWIDSAWARADRGFAHSRELGRVRWLSVSGTTVPETSAPVFHLRLTASAVGNWARTVTARAAVGHPALTWKVPADPAKSPPILPAPVPAPLSMEEFQDFVKEAETGLLTPSGLALLRILTAAPLTPAIMRLVQRSIYPSMGHEQLSEVHRSGLLYRLPGQPESKDPDRVHYDFLPVREPDGTVRENAMRDHFFNQAGWDRVDAVRELVGDFIARQHGLDSWSVEALERAKEQDGDASAEELRPFARVMGHVLGRFGERFEEQAKALTAWGRGDSAAAPTGLPEPISTEPIDGRPATLINSVGMTMLGIPSGTFIMGSPDDEPGRDADDFALHQVILSDPFRIAQTPVTQKQWGDVMGTTVEEQKAKGSAYGEVTGTGDDHPVYFVNWEDALRFCDALTDKENRRAEGLAYALPTEAQWEYACRAGTSSPYNVPEVDPTQLGWFAENSGGSTHSVREKMPNAWGLDDCHGNVWEWCADWFERSTSTEAITDPQGPPSGADRVLRGGSWGSVARRCRSASRDRYFPAFRDRDVGFRPVLSPVKQREAQGVLPPEPEAAAQPEPEVQEEAARSVRPHFVPIKGGTFLMGSPETEEGRFDQEDLHQVALTRDFEIADAPVTQAQYEAVMGSNPSQFKDSGPDAPVETVSWEDAVAFCEKLTAEDPEWIYRLPTEAQWEYACRAGTKGRWNVDGADLKDLGWYDENSEKKTHPVRQKQPNAWGLHDCHGNVFEWCQDWFTEHLGATAVTDPQGPEIGIICVLRGGSWRDGAQGCRSAYRSGSLPADRIRRIGFRPVRMKKAEGTVPEPVPTQEAEVKAGARSSAWIARDFDVPPAPGMKMLCIGAGDFAMGEGSEAHPVTLTEDFFVAETPVTQAQYEAVMGTNPSHFKQVGPEGPVEQVSWEDAVAFCARLNQIAEPEDGWEWALPTEAQWEYACRAGTTTAFSFGDVLNGTQANCDGNHPEGTEEKGAYLKRTSPVRSYAPNPWGLYDCHGNVWEWCADWYGKYPKEAVADPQGAESGADRVLRGGSWYGEAQRCRSANRLSYTPDYRGNDIGFRPVLTRKKQAEGTEPEPAPTQEAEVKAGARSRRADYVAADFANGLGMGMVCVEPGAFAMGSPVGGEGRESESWMGKETQHPVTLTEPFWIAKTPLTQGIWSTLMGTTVAEQKAKGSAYGEVTGTGDHHPVYFVNWEEALAACDRLSIREREAGRLPDGYLYTLPTEAQWEYACRAGTEGPFNVEGASLQDLGWYADNSGKSTHPTAEKTPNGWGLHDCHGNVWEWCADWYQEDLGAAAATDPKGPESGNRRVLRGGSWSGVAQSCRSASRGRFNPAYRYDFIGFRPVLSPRKQRTDLSVLPAELEAVAQPEPPAPTAAGQIRPVFVPIPAGKFLMGSPENEKGRFDDETQHEVTLTRAFEIADAPVTQAQYEAVMGSNPSRFKESGPDAPVEQVSWEDSVAWCRKMSETDPHYEYRLPTEAEWEYVCRAGTTGPYNVDGADLANLGWFDANSGQKTHSVREKAPNTWGLHECHGNVREWCADRYQKDLGSNAATDPQGPQSGSDRVLRGGSWSSTAQYCRSAFRGGDSPGSRHRHFGFRPVRVKKAEGTVLEAVAQPEPEAGARSPRRGLFGGLFGGKR